MLSFKNTIAKTTLKFLQVVGIPVTLNGDLKNQFIETNVGYDTICKVKDFSALS